MQENAKIPSKHASTRGMRTKAIIVLVFILCVGFLGVDIRLAYLQLVDGEFYEEKAVDQQLWDTPIYAKRGAIYDRNMKVLAQSASAYTVFLSPKYIKDEEQRVAIAQGLSEILDMDYDKIYSLAEKSESQYELVKRRIEEEDAEKIRQLIKEHNLNSVALADDNKRYYPYGTLASQILGFTGTDSQGLYGIEMYYEEELSGIDGRAITAKNAVGGEMPFSYETRVEAQDGYSLVLTIDEVVQHFLEKYLEEIYVNFEVQESTTGIIIDVNTGEILAMASYPDFDPNSPYTVTNKTALEEISQYEEGTEEYSSALKAARETMWRNKAISDLYEPGSTFKTLVAAMALEEGVATPNSTFTCNGYLKIASETIHCFRRRGHGHETFTQGLENSCNPVFMTVAAALGSDKFYNYFEAFGLTQKTGIDIPGEVGSIYHSKSNLGEVELAVSSFGQTNKVTPIQMVTALAAATNGGYLIEPHVVKQVVDSDGNIVKNYGTNIKRQVVSEETSKVLCKMLESVVETGSAKNAAVVGYAVGGKTGTSEKTDEKNEEGQIDKVIASMFAVAPADDPQIAILMLADEPEAAMHSGGTVCGPAISSILTEILPYLGVEPSFTDDELEQLDVRTPNMVGFELDEALEDISYKYLVADVRGNGDTVIAQIPEGGTSIPRGGKVIIYTEQEKLSTAIVPDVTGLTPSQATQALKNAGFNVRFNGTSGDGTLKVYDQSIPPETEAEEGSVITVYARVEASGE